MLKAAEAKDTTKIFLVTLPQVGGHGFALGADRGIFPILVDAPPEAAAQSVSKAFDNVAADHRGRALAVFHALDRLAHRSISPNTMSREPITAETSASMWPRFIQSMAARCGKPGARILQR